MFPEDGITRAREDSEGRDKRQWQITNFLMILLLPLQKVSYDELVIYRDWCPQLGPTRVPVSQNKSHHKSCLPERIIPAIT